MHAVGTCCPLSSCLRRTSVITRQPCRPPHTARSFWDNIGRVVTQRSDQPCSSEHMHVPMYMHAFAKYCSTANRALWSLPQGNAEKASIPLESPACFFSWMHDRYLSSGPQPSITRQSSCLRQTATSSLCIMRLVLRSLMLWIQGTELHPHPAPH